MARPSLSPTRSPAAAAVAFVAIVALGGAGVLGFAALAPRGNGAGDDAGPARGGPGSRATPTMAASVAAADGDADAADDRDEEAAEQGGEVQERLEALERSREAGTFGQRVVTPKAAAAGWAGEQPIANAADDWEPAIAADPAAPYAYALVTRYGAAKPCPGNCPTPYIAVYTSSNGGASWSGGGPLCACKGSGQFDPIIEVVPSTGHVYAAYMNGFNVVFVKSVNHGSTWTAPVNTYGNVSWNDKPVLAMSDDGRDVYISFNGPTGGDPYAAQSHDFGATWTQTKLVDSNRYYFAFDADVAPDGTVYFAETALLYGGGGNKGSTPSGTIDEHVFVSRDKGAHWEDHVAAQVQPGLACTADGCTPDFYLGHTALTADAAGALVLAYDGAATAGGRQTIEARRSSDGGRTWSAPLTLSTVGEESTSPAIESRGSGDVRAWWMQTSGGGNVDAWNVWYRRSTDGGATWSSAVRLSDAASGAGYKTAAGFAEVYGDYGELAITSAGKSIAIWGEGFSYTGPGGVWFNREP